MNKSHLIRAHSASRRVPGSGVLRFSMIVILVLAGSFTLGFTPIQDDEYDTNAVQDAPDNVRFTSVDLIIDSRGSPLAAWQIEFISPQNVTIVGIQNGDFAADPLHHDPAAIQNNRVILAQYSLDDASELPLGEMRAATIHLRVEGELDTDQLKLELTAAGDARGERLNDANARIESKND